MKDIAGKTGLSLATVSRVFNDADKVSPKTRNLVLKVARELNFRPNKMASALRSGRSQTIGIVVPFIGRDIFSVSIQRMEEVLSAAGYSIIICQSHESAEKEKEILENLKQLRVDGVIMSVSKETKDASAIQAMKEEGVPVVLFDRTVELDDINSVLINNFNGAYQAATHLVEQGCQQIAYLAGNDNVSIFKERRRGFEMAMKDLGREIVPRQIIDFDDGTESGVATLLALLAGPHRPDGILANGDLAALVAIKCLRQMNLRMPEDVAIIGFGDSTFCPYLDPALSSVSQRNEDVGRLSAETILKELQTKDKQEIVYIRQMLPPKVVVRASSQKK
ncbi:MAG: LacI family DNA-binding transcriptional regulator [Bacteroidota bacterium]